MSEAGGYRNLGAEILLLFRWEARLDPYNKTCKGKGLQLFLGEVLTSYRQKIRSAHLIFMAGDSPLYDITLCISF